MSTGNLLLAYPNLADATTLSGGAWETTLPLTHLQNRIQAVVARSTDLDSASTQFTIALTKSRVIDLLALCGHNFSLDATVQIQASDASDFATLVYDSGAIAVWPALFASENLEWEDDNWWSGQIDAETRANYPSHFNHRPTQIAARYWKVLVTDAGNADGYVQIGRLFIGAAWQPEVNYDYGSTFGFETDTGVEKALGGQEYFDRRTGRRVFRCQLSWLSEQEAYERAWEIQRSLGYDGEVFVNIDPANVTQQIRLAFPARLRQLSALEHPYFAYHKMAVEIAELL
jgi:hypothetical protein